MLHQEYIMALFGIALFDHNSRNEVPLFALLLRRDFEVADTLPWGSVVLQLYITSYVKLPEPQFTRLSHYWYSIGVNLRVYLYTLILHIQ